MALTKVTDSIIDFDTLTIAGTQAADTTYLKLQNTPATAATHKVAMEFWGNEGTANGSTFNMGRIYGEFDGSSYSTTRLTLGSASGNGTFNDEISLKNGTVGIGTTSPTTYYNTGLNIHGASNAAIKFTNNDTGTTNDDGVDLALDDSENFRIINRENYGIQFFCNAAQRMEIDASTRLFVGKTAINQTTTAGWEINNPGGCGRQDFSVSNNEFYIYNNYSASAAATMSFRWNNSQVGSIVLSSSGVAFNTTSDYRLKENVSYDWDATTRLNQLRPARFNWISDDSNTLVDGFLAHEVSDIVPEAITGTKDAVKNDEFEVTPAVMGEDGGVETEAVIETREVPDYQTIDQSKLVPLLVKALQEANAKIETLETRIETLENA